MKNRFLYLAFALLFASPTFALPLPNGSTAPDFELTDVNGETHHLYDYLDQGITVVLKFSATWCGICWNYHNGPNLKNLYNQYGPNGTNQVMVLFIEADPNTPESALYGGSGSVGDWVTGTPYPVIHAPDNTVPEAYQIFSYPTLYAICPNRKTYNVGTAPLNTWVNWLGSCSLDAELGSTQMPSCPGLSDGSLSLNTSGGTGTLEYLWSNDETSPNLSNIGAGSYTCTITEGQGHSIVAGPFELLEPETLEITLLNTQPVDCPGNAGGEATVFASGGTGSDYSYLWSDGQTGPTASNLSEGSYTVQVLDENSCASEMFEVLIEVSDLIAPEISCPDDIVLTACMGEVTEYALPTAQDNCEGNLNFELLEGLPSGSVFPPGVTLVQFQVSDASGNTAECSFTVTANTPLDYNTASGASCPLSSDGWATITVFNAAPPLTYEWSTGSTLSALSGVAAGSYQVTVTDANDCNVVASIDIDEFPEIAFEILLISPQTSAFDLGAIEVNIEGGLPPYNVVWRNADGNIVSSEQNADGLPSGLYQCQITDGNGCVFFSNLVLVPMLTSVSEHINEAAFELFPNPAQDQVWLRWQSSNTAGALVQIYDTQGRLVHTQQAPSAATELRIAVGSLPSGLYLIQLKQAGQMVGVKKMLIR